MLVVDVVTCLLALSLTPLDGFSPWDILRLWPLEEPVSSFGRPLGIPSSITLTPIGARVSQSENATLATLIDAPPGVLRGRGERGGGKYTGLGGGKYTGLGTDLDNHANQMNPNNWRYWSSRGMDPPVTNGGDQRPARRTQNRGGYTGLGTTADLDNHANQMNPNNWRYWSSRGLDPPVKNGGDQGPARPTEEKGVYAGLGTKDDLDVKTIWPVVYWFSLFIIHSVFIIKYRRHVMAKKPKLLSVDALPEAWRLSGRRFRTSIQDECCWAVPRLLCSSEESSIVRHSCCCTIVRISDTYSSANLGNFCTHVVLAYTLLVALPYVLLYSPAGWVGLSWCVLAGRGAYAFCFAVRRGQLRRLLGGSGHFLKDCCCLFWCSRCAAAQEARQVDGALGVHVECCCVLVKAPENALPLVGLPVGLTTELGVQARPLIL